MKVLWFSLSPGLGDKYINDSYKGIGWVKALQSYIEAKVELSIAFYVDKPFEVFTIGPTTYLPVTRYSKGRLSKIKERVLNRLEKEDHIALFVKIINEVKPDVIHVHGTEGPFALIQKYTNIPVVVSIQGIITVYKYKYFSSITYLDALKKSRLKNLIFLRSVINIYSRFKKMAAREQEIFNLTRHCIGRTAWDRRLTQVLAPSANYYHNDEILRPSFYQNKWDNKLKSKVILFTTTGIDIYKGIETVIYCATILDANNIDYEWHVAGISRGNDVLDIATSSINKPLSPNIKFLGSLDEDKLIKHLLNSNIYVACSHIENSPNSLCEAQILGLPCIATHAGGTNTLLEDKKDGILIQDGDPYSMAGAIIELMNNYDAAILYGENSRAKALKRHDPEVIVSALLEIYNQVMLPK